MSDIRKKLIQECSEVISVNNRERVKVDLPFLIESLLLFETYILKSNNLREIPELIHSFGFAQTIELLNSGILKICSEAITTAAMSHNKGIPLNNPYYLFSAVRGINNDHNFDLRFNDICNDINLSNRNKVKLKNAIHSSMINYDISTTRQLLSNLIYDQFFA